MKRIMFNNILQYVSLKFMASPYQMHADITQTYQMSSYKIYNETKIHHYPRLMQQKSVKRYWPSPYWHISCQVTSCTGFQPCPLQAIIYLVTFGTNGSTLTMRDHSTVDQFRCRLPTKLSFAYQLPSVQWRGLSGKHVLLLVTIPGPGF